MSTPATERVLILNPASGGCPEDPSVVSEAVRALGPCRVLVTEGEGDARRFAAAAGKARAREVLVAGGDGTVHQVVRGLLDAVAEGGEGGEPRIPTLAILPLGTGNDLARCLGIPLEWERALELLRIGGRVREVDLMDVTVDGESLPGVNAVVVGSGGRVGQVLEPREKERWGPLSYLRSAAEVILHLEPVPLELVVDDGAAEALEALNIVVANGRYAARGIPISPGADPSDGRLDLVVVREAGVGDLVAMLPVLLHGSHPDHPAYSHRHVSRIRITATGPDPLPVSVDGENRRAREISVVLHPLRLSIRVPAS
ncbi:MAG TPA: diacylglycerol kinase family protein [Longimicrobiales bacterium]|nr:diacylglycerol kinase family protein [Longimicrobiales bacterium]